MPKAVYFLSLLFFFHASYTQNTENISLFNPSFEDIPQPNYTPRGWYDCGFENEYVNSLHAGKSPFSGITQKAVVGNTYIGLVVRKNYTWEGIGQELKSPMELGNCYEFHIKLCQSEHYYSRNYLGEKVNYSHPAKIKIWGGNINCERKELLAETDVIEHFNWRDYVFVLSPQSNSMTHIRIEAFHLEDSLKAYNGNVLLDHATPLIQIECDEKEEVENRDISHLPSNWYNIYMSFSERMERAKSNWRTRLVSNIYRPDSEPYKHKVRIKLTDLDELDDAILKFSKALEIPADLSKDGFIITLVSESLKEKKYTYPLLERALQEMKVPWEQYRIYSEIERSKKYRKRSDKKHIIYLELTSKSSLERIIIQLENAMEEEKADLKADNFVLDVAVSKQDRRILEKRIKKAMEVLEVLSSQYAIKFSDSKK